MAGGGAQGGVAEGGGEGSAGGVRHFVVLIVGGDLGGKGSEKTGGSFRIDRGDRW